MIKTANGLVAYARAQVGRPYWLGGFGQAAGRTLYEQNRIRLKYGPWEGDYAGDTGKKVHDCNGLVKGYCWTDGPNIPWREGQYAINGCGDWGVDVMYERCTQKGTVAGGIPPIPGLLVFTKSMSHMGVYDGNGFILEARGREYGVQNNRLGDRAALELWGKASWLSYESAAEQPTSFSGQVREFQLFLNEKYRRGLAADGRCGPGTKMSAIAGMQAELNRRGESLAVDGYCGAATRAAMTRHMVKRGTKGNMAFIVQGLLYGAGYDCNGFDGSVGAGCDAAIRRYQAHKGLEVDGKVGGETLYRLTR
jgi:cell wall-associated NlpC family hydrolase